MMRRRFLNNIKNISSGNNSEYLTIEALEDGLTAKLSTNACEYRIDNGSWNTLSANSTTPSINKGQTLSFKGSLTPNSSNGIGTFTISKKCNLKGNIMSLLYGDDFKEQNDLSGKNYAFYKLFYNCSILTDASNLILPAITLADSCYSNMFYGCGGLTITPKLPATTLAEWCYYNMFRDCTNLTTAPELPVTTLAEGCYSSMFRGCTRLTSAPELPAITLADYCYYYMFSGCTSLITAPELPATTLANDCYHNMFSGCSKLNKITMLATNISASNCLYNWVNGVSSTGTFVKNAAMTTLPSGASGIPTGWTVVNDGETNLITFTVDGSEYQAEEGMTWGDWINKYGDLGLFYIQNDYIYFYISPQLMSLTNSSSQPVYINDIIQKDDIYYVESGGSAA